MPTRFCKNLPILAAAAAAAALAIGPTSAIAADEATMTNPSEIKWGDAPPQLPKGAKVAVLHGDPTKEGSFTLRLRTPGHYKIAPHWHSHDENLTVISGAFYLGMGDKMDTKGAHLLKAGGYHFLPGKAHHYAYSKGASEIQVTGTGPFDITYLNPADDPTKSH
jgi:hypothetical protein